MIDIKLFRFHFKCVIWIYYQSKPQVFLQVLQFHFQYSGEITIQRDTQLSLRRSAISKCFLVTLFFQNMARALIIFKWHQTRR